MTCHDYIAQHAGPLAQAVRHFLARKIPYQQLEDLSWQLLSHWQALCVIPMDKTPANAQEGVFWHLLHSLHLWDEQHLLCDDALRLQLMACANFLADEGPCPHHCIGSRP
ncbi:hypothetical protein [uncultured Aeromonas sp.]|uniref:hypothetical protein n=1 Tax=Aeromonas caviae TaxID=648 RepID=UPI00258F81F9|nr:hypothetical protein [uncultured Aeromonas sp.]